MSWGAARRFVLENRDAYSIVFWCRTTWWSKSQHSAVVLSSPNLTLSRSEWSECFNASATLASACMTLSNSIWHRIINTDANNRPEHLPVSRAILYSFVYRLSKTTCKWLQAGSLYKQQASIPKTVAAMFLRVRRLHAVEPTRYWANLNSNSSFCKRIWNPMTQRSSKPAPQSNGGPSATTHP